MSVVLGYLFLVLVLVARTWQYCAVLDRMVWPPSAWIISTGVEVWSSGAVDVLLDLPGAG